MVRTKVILASSHCGIYSGIYSGMSAFSPDITLEHTLVGHKKAVTWLLVDNGQLFTASYDGTVKIWDIADHTLIVTLVVVHDLEDKSICALAMCDGKLYVPTYDGYLYAYDCTTSDFNLISTLAPAETHSEGVGIMSLAIDNSTKLLYTGGQRDALIKVWNISTPTAITLVTTLSGGDWGHRNYVSCLAIGNGKLYSGSFDRTIIVWNLSDHTLIKTLREHESPVSALLYNRQQGLLYSSSCDNTIRIWDTNYGCGEEVCIIKNNGQNPWGLAMANSSTSGNGSDVSDGNGDGNNASNDGSNSIDGRLYVSDLHKTIKVWNCHKDTLYHAEGRDTIHYKSSEDGQGSLISTFDRSAGSDPVPPALSICLSDGKLFSAGENNSVIVWKVE